MSDTAALLHANLFEVFNEPDEQRRAGAIDRTYAADVEWTDDEGVVTGREALALKATALRGTLTGLEFTTAGPAHELAGFGYLAWNLAPPGGEAVVSGFDVVLARDGLISALYTVVTTTPQG
ncbi:hypothetical protein BH09ACT8_BH09ACT8_10360 [soil metagenome]